MNNKNTKRALLTSVLSLAVCGSMLVGTTFAWFTDSVSSVNNVITTGNLDVKVEYTLDGEEWKDLDGAKDLFQKGLWEPGHTEVVALKIKNEGTLALKYAANMNLIDETVGTNKDGEDIVLSEILTVSTLTQQAIDENGNANQVGDIALGLAFNGENSVAYQNTTTFKAGNVLGNDVELQPGAAHYLIVKVDMADTVGNEANAKDKDSVPSINFGINVTATQFAYENDSFGNDYDVNATYTTEDSIKNANGYVVVANDVALREAKTELKKPATLNLNGKTISATRSYESGMNAAQISTLAVCNDVTLTGNGTVINNGVGYGIVVRDGGDLVIENGYYYGNTSAVQVSEGTLEIKGGHFEDLNAEDNGHYLINCIDSNYGNGTAKVVITGGTFVNWNPANNTSEGKGTKFVALGYEVVPEIKEGGDIWYTVVESTGEVAPTVVATVADLKTALTEATNNGETEVVINANGANIGALNYELTKASVPAGTTVTIKNAVVEGRSYGNGVDGTVIFENCTFTHANGGAYSIHFDNGNGDVIFKNCTLEGWCSFGSAINSVTMENCTIKGNGVYAMCRFYQNATLTNCTIDCSDANDTDGYPDGISAVNGATVTLNGCTFVYCDYEYAENAKIVVDSVTVAGF